MQSSNSNDLKMGSVRLELGALVLGHECKGFLLLKR